MNVEILLGKTREHLVPIEGTKLLVHKQMMKSFLRLQKDAVADGFDLQIISAFRDFDRQLFIWNAKARGERKLLDDQDNQLAFSELSPKELLFSILRWSAIPGCSRHHWGSDIDVFDANTQLHDKVQLLPSECENLGPAAKMHEWLSLRIDQADAHGFFRPYKTDRGGVSPEPWHLSYSPVSSSMQKNFTFPLFLQHIKGCDDLLLKREILENADEVFQNYIANTDLP